jgi:hypothetical protein
VPGTLDVAWPLGAGRRWRLVARLADTADDSGHVPLPPGCPVYRSHPDTTAHWPPWSVHLALIA